LSRVVVRVPARQQPEHRQAPGLRRRAGQRLAVAADRHAAQDLDPQHLTL
jgi:hypothetical protein